MNQWSTRFTETITQSRSKGPNRVGKKQNQNGIIIFFSMERLPPRFANIINVRYFPIKNKLYSELWTLLMATKAFFASRYFRLSTRVDTEENRTYVTAILDSFCIQIRLKFTPVLTCYLFIYNIIRLGRRQGRCLTRKVLDR
jgi:hypothetical protein